MTGFDRKKEAKELLDHLLELYDQVVKKGDEYFERYKHKIKRDDFYNSALNLSYYLALRNHDLRQLQSKLAPLGISSLGRLESKTLATLRSVIHSLAAISQEEVQIPFSDDEDFSRGLVKLDKNIQEILGKKSPKRRTLIMATLPTEAAKDIYLVRRLIKAGMNIARINCAHDDPETWRSMIENVRDVAKSENKDIRVMMDIAGPKIRTEWIFTRYKNPKMQVGDQLLMTSDFSKLPLDFEGKTVVGSDIKPIYKVLKPGDPVLIDDGSLECSVVEATGTHALLKVEKVKGNGVRIKAEKGLNFPNSQFEMAIITDKDRGDITFATEHADIIGCSFVRTGEDIQEIQAYLQEICPDKAQEIPLLAKIETVQGVENLAEIIYSAASKNPFAVMIARGDLAVETGYIRLAEVQQEILWVCEAADVPVVWGTEVLANLINTGIPTRAEVTDAAEGATADCVMINKGTYMEEAVSMLDEIFQRMRRHQYKKTPRLRALNIADLDQE